MPLNLKELFRSDSDRSEDRAISQGLGAAAGFYGAHQINGLADAGNNFEAKARDLATRPIRKIETLPSSLSFLKDYSDFYSDASKHRLFGVPVGLPFGLIKSLFTENKDFDRTLFPKDVGMSYRQKLKLILEKKKGDLAHFYDYSFKSKPELLVHQILDRAPLLGLTNDNIAFNNFSKFKDLIKKDLLGHTDLKDLAAKIQAGSQHADPSTANAYKYVNKYLTGEGVTGLLKSEPHSLRNFATPKFHSIIQRVGKLGPVAGALGLGSTGLALSSLYNASKS